MVSRPKHSSDFNDAFERESQTRPPGFFVEFFDFLVHNKKWWLTPIILVLLLLSLLIAMTNSAIGPFIYVLFYSLVGHQPVYINPDSTC